ncbi:MAG: hypothetical protein GQ547_08495 [Methylophaga sp.]|nr:hypothetical protein [Methylophaga sp.]
MTVKNKIILNAGTIPHVALDFMNSTHFEEIELVEKLGATITEYEQNKAPTSEQTKTLNTLLEEWLSHTQAHFDRENTLMQEIQFPMSLVHSSEHERVLANMTDIIQTWQRNADIELLAEYVFSSWPQWFDNHVNSMDMITAHFAVMHGFDPHTTVDD